MVGRIIRIQKKPFGSIIAISNRLRAVDELQPTARRLPTRIQRRVSRPVCECVLAVSMTQNHDRKPFHVENRLDQLLAGFANPLSYMSPATYFM